MKGIYVISPPQISNPERFFEALEEICSQTIKPAAFQLRLKNASQEDVVRNLEKSINITQKFGVPIFINDDTGLARQYKIGVHVGEEDASENDCEKLVEDGIPVGVSCYGDILRALTYAKIGVTYVAFGAFFETKTKEITKPRPDSKTIYNFKKACHDAQVLAPPTCAIGGINPSNISQIISMKADMAAVVSGVWG